MDDHFVLPAPSAAGSAARTKRRPAQVWVLAVVPSIVLLVSLGRALGFGEGIVLGATPAAGVALAAALWFGRAGALAAAAGYAVSGALWGLPGGAILTDAVAHGLAALLAARAMTALARRRRTDSRTAQLLIFLPGVLVFTAVVALAVATGVATGLLLPPPDPRLAPLLVAVFTPFGIMTTCAVLFSLREVGAVRGDPLPALPMAGLALVLLALLHLLIGARLEHVTPSGITLLLSVPMCLWVAMQHRSLDGAVLAWLAGHAALVIVLGEFGSVGQGQFVTTVLFLNLLVGVCQLVHAINRDRLEALAENAAHRLELERRVASRTASLRAMTRRAIEADTAKSKLLATVSHEVRTPLNGVIGMASAMLAGPLDPPTRRNVEVIRTSGLHLLDVINRILDYARLGHDAAEVRDEAFDLRTLVAEVLDEARAAPQAAGLVLQAEIAPGLAPGRHGHRQGLRQVLTNLVGNAAKFTEQGGVTVRLAGLPHDWVRLEVEDSGMGIAPDLQDRVFRPFEQVDDPRVARQPGTGLGLSISAEIVERMGGRIGVVSAEGSGAVFWVEVPLARSGSDPLPFRARAAG